MTSSQRDPMTEADQLNDYRAVTDGWCPVAMSCRSGGSLRTDADVIAHLMTHRTEELAWALLSQDASTSRLCDLIVYRFDRNRAGEVPYAVTGASHQTTDEIDTVLNTVAATMRRVVPPHLHEALGLKGNRRAASLPAATEEHTDRLGADAQPSASREPGIEVIGVPVGGRSEGRRSALRPADADADAPSRHSR
ncbi:MULTISPECIES: hypothetical protein [Streptomyces]|uniref:hypothetical protein n=1 Tax=Streptomyces TaxID=1883 RepID=UPI00287F7BC9|nr:hypothetical protein [Streptomyces sp. CGMCC 4.1456]WNF67160.1 hypothetical protein RJD14_33360 [Streptomyces sp. CGMCC 4.1456]